MPGEGISIDDIKEYVGKKCLKLWKSDVKDNTVTFYMCNSVHSIPQYTVVINESVEITSFTYNWPIPHDHQEYNECKHSISTCAQIKELLNAIEKSMICKGLPDDSTVKSVAIDPNVQIQLYQFLEQSYVIRFLMHHLQSNLKQLSFIGSRIAMFYWRPPNVVIHVTNLPSN